MSVLQFQTSQKRLSHCSMHKVSCNPSVDCGNPSLDDCNQSIDTQAHDWYILGVYLNMRVRELNTIESARPPAEIGRSVVCSDMQQYWLDTIMTGHQNDCFMERTKALENQHAAWHHKRHRSHYCCTSMAYAKVVSELRCLYQLWLSIKARFFPLQPVRYQRVCPLLHHDRQAKNNPRCIHKYAEQSPYCYNSYNISVSTN